MKPNVSLVFATVVVLLAGVSFGFFLSIYVKTADPVIVEKIDFDQSLLDQENVIFLLESQFLGLLENISFQVVGEIAAIEEESLSLLARDGVQSLGLTMDPDVRIFVGQSEFEMIEGELMENIVEISRGDLSVGDPVSVNCIFSENPFTRVADGCLVTGILRVTEGVIGNATP